MLAQIKDSIKVSHCENITTYKLNIDTAVLFYMRHKSVFKFN